MGLADAGPTWDLGPSQLEASSPEAASHTGIHASLGSRLWDATTQCSLAHGRWTASTLSP